MRRSCLLACVYVLVVGCVTEHTKTPADGSVDGTTGPRGDGGTDATLPDAASKPEPCTELGKLRVVPCGNCGMWSQRCETEGWVPQSECLSQGECALGTVDVDALPMCSERQRLCDGTCHWTEWSETKKPGVCEPGKEQLVAGLCPAGTFTKQVCSSSCKWETKDVCVDPCGGENRRATPPDAEEICIPAGPFLRGIEKDDNGAEADSVPMREVYVSAFYMDRYPVTNRRYKACMDADVCTQPPDEKVQARLKDPKYADYLVATFWQQAIEFCAWDGGRRPPTEAEWEKAARGPAPRTNRYPWDGTEYRCDLYPSLYCGPLPAEYGDAGDRYDALPGTRSYYGVEMLLGSGGEGVLDFYAADYYERDDSLRDPRGPETGRYRAGRGHSRLFNLEPKVTITRRRMLFSGAEELGSQSVRCVRDAK